MFRIQLWNTRLCSLASNCCTEFRIGILIGGQWQAIPQGTEGDLSYTPYDWLSCSHRVPLLLLGCLSSDSTGNKPRTPDGISKYLMRLRQAATDDTLVSIAMVLIDSNCSYNYPSAYQYLVRGCFFWLTCLSAMSECKWRIVSNTPTHTFW